MIKVSEEMKFTNRNDEIVTVVPVTVEFGKLVRNKNFMERIRNNVEVLKFDLQMSRHFPYSNFLFHANFIPYIAYN